MDSGDWAVHFSGPSKKLLTIRVRRNVDYDDDDETVDDGSGTSYEDSTDVDNSELGGSHETISPVHRIVVSPTTPIFDVNTNSNERKQKLK